MFLTFNIWLLIVFAMILYIIFRSMKLSKEASIVMILIYFISAIAAFNIDRWVK